MRSLGPKKSKEGKGKKKIGFTSCRAKDFIVLGCLRASSPPLQQHRRILLGSVNLLVEHLHDHGSAQLRDRVILY